MIEFVLYLIALAVLRAVRRQRMPKPRGLCSTCVFVHMQYGVNGRNAVFCTYNGVARPVVLDVMYCTDYRDRSVPVSLGRIGFLSGDVETVAELATTDR